MSRKKIFRLFSRLNVGGPSLHVVNLAVGLTERGYDTKLLVGQPHASEGSMEYYAHEAGANVRVIPTFRAAISPFHDLITFARLIFLFATERPDIVHTHTFKAGLLGRLAAWCTGVPVIVHTYHGHLLSGYSQAWKVQILIRIERFLGRLTNHLLAVSSQVATDLIKAGIAPEEKFEVVELGFNLERLDREMALEGTLRTEYKIPAEALVVGIIGRLVPVKAVDLFVEALGPLLGTWPRLHLVIIGDGSERARLECAARRFDRTFSNIHFTGWRKCIASDLRDIDVCVCSSKNEGTSVSIIEALIAGVPVVSTNVGGMADLLEQGRWGQLVSQDAISIRQAVVEILDDPSRREIARANAAKIRSRFDQTRLVEAVDRIYRRGSHAKPVNASI